MRTDCTTHVVPSSGQVVGIDTIVPNYNSSDNIMCQHVTVVCINVQKNSELASCNDKSSTDTMV